jgi:seryl-tRNA synthetase
MLDIRKIREEQDAVKERLATRGTDFAAAIDEVIECDRMRRGYETELQTLQAERNKLSKQIGALKAKQQPTAEIEATVKGFAARMAELNALTAALDQRQQDILLRLPNLPHANATIGPDASANPVIRTWGEKPALKKPKDHVALAESLKLLDFERATKISGAGFLVFRGAGARLERALLNFLLDLHTRDHGYLEVSPPFLIRREAMIGTGQLPKFEEDMYGLEEGAVFLAPTAEVPVTNLHREEILALTQLPIKLAAYTPCFRREAGSAGRETRGMIRVHQFDKVELVKIVHPETSYAELESLTADAEKVLQLLGLHYRVVELCTGDLGFGAAKTYDIEVWAPGQQAYLEVSSCSNFEDFQARRMNLKFKDAAGKNQFCHTLNGSGTALPRLYVALLETYQQPDGSIRIPEALQEAFGAEVIAA